MAKDPILPLYYNDLRGTTATWSDEELGAYVRLLIEQWDKGFLPNDYQRLTRLATSLPTTWPLIKDKFPEVDGVLKNPVMEAIRLKRLKFKEKQSDNIRKRYQNSTKSITKKLPLESENEIEGIKELHAKIDSWPTFEDFWNKYAKKIDRPKCESRFKKISQADREKIMRHLIAYIPATTDLQFRKDPATYLNNRSWENDVIQANGSSVKQVNEFEDAEYNKSLWTKEAWEKQYARNLTDNKFRKHFGYEELPSRTPVDSNAKR